MSDQNDVVIKTMQLEGDALDAAAEVIEVMRRQTRDLIELQEEYASRHGAIAEVTREDMRTLCARICEPNGISLDDFWEGMWEIDTSYLENHGLAFIKQDSRNLPSQGAGIAPKVASQDDKSMERLTSMVTPSKKHAN